MKDHPSGAGMKCEEFLALLEGLPTAEAVAQPWPAGLHEEARAHSTRCGQCEGALRDFMETRSALEGVRARLPEPGPWFVPRVMGLIRAQENEQEEKKNGVWVSVMRLAPRLAAFGAVVLVLGGTWALELRRTDRQSREPELRPVEGLFEAWPSAPVNDDVIAGTYGRYQERQP